MIPNYQNLTIISPLNHFPLKLIDFLQNDLINKHKFYHISCLIMTLIEIK